MFSLIKCKQLKEIEAEQRRLEKEWQRNVRVQTQKMHGFAESIFFRDLWFDLSSVHAEVKKLVAIHSLEVAAENRKLSSSEKRALVQLQDRLDRDPARAKVLARSYIKHLTAADLVQYEKMLTDDVRYKQFLLDKYNAILKGMFDKAGEKKRLFLRHYRLLQDAKKSLADPKDVTWIDTLNVLIDDQQFKEFVSSDMTSIDDGDPQNMRTTLLPDGFLQTLMTHYTKLLNASDKYIEWAHGAKEELHGMSFNVALPEAAAEETLLQQESSP
ncbi:hypothetical protein HY772_02690 [Candidatus Woesearchaeota archaeon]|nr:hypothetical protein [Candidatus Woesearchaeota archaeon]